MMKKYKCVNRECGENCIVESKKFHPAKCPMFTENFHLQADWRKVTEPVTESNQLPKLTAEVFDRPDCPEWAQWAAVDKYRNAMWYEGEPKVIGSVFWNSKRGKIHAIPGDWDASDWQNSLIERPAKLPEWCKPGEWVWLDPKKIHGSVGYEKIKTINGLELRFKSGTGVYFSQKIKQARLRPYNADEMRALIGKVIVEKKSGDIGLVTGYCNRNESVYAGRNDFVAALLLSDYTIDGQPCGKLEHLENGEWVE